eukprot:GHVS01064226.1.p1 GENE.GHVS01064226.1~~GHVS01064226.1.p1  ORF type:complete len:126 (+),score=6.29 GHVS01064226.1:221-598(+)
MVKSGKGTVSSSSLKKSELVAVLANRAASSRERNRAVKLLKKFDPNPHKDMDDHFDLKSVRVNKFDQLQAYICYRCDKVKQTNIKVTWNTPIGQKSICNTCYSNLCSLSDLERARKHNDIMAAGQ